MPAATVQPMAVISGSDMVAGRERHGQPVIQTRGMDHSAIIDSMGFFTLKVPAGSIRLNIQGINSTTLPLDTLIDLKPGDHVELRPTQQRWSKPCIGIDCNKTVSQIKPDAEISNS